jgi:hypothetical protein
LYNAVDVAQYSKSDAEYVNSLPSGVGTGCSRLTLEPLELHMGSTHIVFGSGSGLGQARGFLLS